jgi:hypothetical protein
MNCVKFAFYLSYLSYRMSWRSYGSRMKTIGGWQCNANWTFMKDGTFEISIPFQRLLRIDEVVIHPEVQDIRLFGTFTPNNILDTNITNGTSCWKTERRYESNGGTDGTS